MSKVNDFFELCSKDNAVAEKLNSVNKAQISAILEIANQYGYQISESELKDELKTIAEKSKDSTANGRCYTLFSECYAVLS